MRRWVLMSSLRLFLSFRTIRRKGSNFTYYQVLLYFAGILKLFIFADKIRISINLTEKTMKDLLASIETAMEAFKKDATAQVESGNKAAGTRARKVSLEIEKAMKQFRKVSLEESKK